jgi:pimeloyl-ACP methyl ester carboxylesterase
VVDVGDHLLYVECSGEGSPTVVLEAGFGGSSPVWRDVQPAVARRSRVCSYDRAGLGGSPAPDVENARTTQTEVDDLERLLASADIQAPYVLVGHSYGGMIARLFADQHSDDVVGMVFVDASHPDFAARARGALPPRRAGEDPALSELRASLRRPAIFEGLDVSTSEAQVRAVMSLGDIPLVVLTAGESDDLTLPDMIKRRFGAVWLQAQTELAGLSSNSVHAVALKSGHFIQDRLTGQPELVNRAIGAVLEAARSEGRLGSSRRVLSGPGVRCVSE